MTQPLDVLWVSAAAPRLREASSAAFARYCSRREIVAGELLCLGDSVSFDVICFDFDFPDMNALRLIPEAKRKWPSTPIIMLTMQKSADLALWALRSRVFDLLIKPVTTAEIDRCIERVGAAVEARRVQRGRHPQTVTQQMPDEVRYHAQPPRATRLQSAVAHVTKHFARDVSESDVAQLCGMSPWHFCREFKAQFGVTFLEYLTAHRMTEAKRLLCNPDMSVADVAAAVGFGDPSYFARVFRRLEGASPSAYQAVASGVRGTDEMLVEPAEAADALIAT